MTELFLLSIVAIYIVIQSTVNVVAIRKLKDAEYLEGESE